MQARSPPGTASAMPIASERTPLRWPTVRHSKGWTQPLVALGGTACWRAARSGCGGRAASIGSCKILRRGQLPWDKVSKRPWRASPSSPCSPGEMSARCASNTSSMAACPTSCASTEGRIPWWARWPPCSKAPSSPAQPAMWQWGPAYRMICDFSDDGLYTSLPGGIDGHFGASTYDCWIDEWRVGGYHRLMPPTQTEGERPG